MPLKLGLRLSLSGRMSSGTSSLAVLPSCCCPVFVCHRKRRGSGWVETSLPFGGLLARRLPI